MTCRYCGNELRDDAKFCPHCGAVSGTAPMAPVYDSPKAPSGGKGKKGLLIGGAVAAVAVIALLTVVVSGMLSNAKGQVEKALSKTAAAYAAAEEKLGMPDVNQWQKDQSIFRSMSLQLRDINSELIGYDLSAFNGSEIGMAAGYSGENRYMLAEMTASLGVDELFHILMVGDDAELYFNSPQFTGETYYGVNTETLGADLTRMTGDDAMDSVSFNLFDLVDMALEHMDSEELEQSIRQANKALWEAAKVKKTGGKTLSLNGTETKTIVFHVTFPQEALDRYVDDMTDVMSAMNYFDLYEEMFRSMGMPEEELEDFLDELEEIDLYGELAGILHDALDDFGDLELDLCLSGGYVSAVLYEDEIGGADVSLALYLGGNGEYVDDLTAELTVEGVEITLKSSGDHSLKGGAYTDETTIRFRQNGVNLARVTSELQYDPKREDDNFQWELEVNSSGLSIFTLDTQGTLYVKEDIVDLTLEDAALNVMGMEICSLRFNCRASRCPDWLGQPLEDAKLITEMDMMELMAFANELQINAETWVEDMQSLFMARLPAELLYGMGFAA